MKRKDMLALEEEELIRLAKDPNTSKKDLFKLATMLHSPSVGRAVSENPNTSSKTLYFILNAFSDESEEMIEIATQVAKHPNLKKKHFKESLHEITWFGWNVYLTPFLIRSPLCKKKHLWALAKRDDSDDAYVVWRALAKYKKTPPEILKYLAENYAQEDDWVIDNILSNNSADLSTLNSLAEYCSTDQLNHLMQHPKISQDLLHTLAQHEDAEVRCFVATQKISLETKRLLAEDKEIEVVEELCLSQDLPFDILLEIPREYWSSNIYNKIWDMYNKKFFIHVLRKLEERGIPHENKSSL